MSAQSYASAPALDREYETARVIFHHRQSPFIVRGLWATWLEDDLVWLCHTAGVGIAPRTFRASCQTSALLEVRLASWIRLFRWQSVRPGLWDGRPDNPLIRYGDPDQLELFPYTPTQRSPAAKARSAAAGAGGASGVYGLVTPIVSPTSGNFGTVSG